MTTSKHKENVARTRLFRSDRDQTAISDHVLSPMYLVPACDTMSDQDEKLNFKT